MILFYLDLDFYLFTYLFYARLTQGQECSRKSYRRKNLHYRK